MSNGQFTAPRVSRRAQSIIDRMIANRQLTPEGMNWLTLATDPFHDVALPPTGYPDLNVCPSLVQCFTSTVSIGSPASTGSGPWEAHIFLAPFSAMIQNSGASSLQAFPYSYLTSTIGAAPTAGVWPTILPGYNVLSGIVGQDWQQTAGYLNATAALHYPVSACGGLYRMIGCGVEVVNTTAELYKSGSVTCYRAPSHRGQVFPTQGFALMCDTFDLPPASQSLAQLYPNSRTWSAAEGYYGIGTISNADNDFLAAIPNMPFGWKPPSVTELTSGSNFNIWSYAPAVIGQQGNGTNTTARVMPFDTHGCVFSGMNSQSTLQVTVKYFVERIPSTSEPDLLVLTRPPSPYDANALELYARTIAELPVGCMVKENPLGEWFNDVLSTVAEYAAPVGALFGPMGAAAGNALAGGAKTWLNSRQTGQQTMGQKSPQKKIPRSVPRIQEVNSNGKKKRKRKRGAQAKAHKRGPTVTDVD